MEKSEEKNKKKTINWQKVAAIAAVIIAACAVLGLIIANLPKTPGPDIEIFLNNDLEGTYEIPYNFALFNSNFTVKLIVKNNANDDRIVTVYMDGQSVYENKINRQTEVEISIPCEIPSNGFKQVHLKAKDAGDNWYEGPSFKVIVGTWMHSIWISSNDVDQGENVTIKVFLTNTGIKRDFKVWFEEFKINLTETSYDPDWLLEQYRLIEVNQYETAEVNFTITFVEPGLYFIRTYAVKDLPYLRGPPEIPIWQLTDQLIDTLVYVYP